MKNTVTQEMIETIISNASVTVETKFDKLTIVTVVLSNGFMLVESTGCVDKANYSEEIGKDICMAKIKDMLWKLEGYKLQCELDNKCCAVPANDSWKHNRDFSTALEHVKQGFGIRLPQWAEDVVIRCQRPDKHSKMTAPYLYVESRFGNVPWKETMIEMFAGNWDLVD